MACYAALLSAMHTLNQIKKHPRPPISLDPKQMDSLIQNLTFFQNFLERYSSGEEDDDLESRIAAAAYETEDVIETHIVDLIHPGSNISTVDLYQGLERAIQDMDLIKKEVTIKEKMGAQRLDKLPKKSSVRPSFNQQISTMVEFDDVLINQVLDKLIGHQSYFQVIPIVGMGGIGKTSFAQIIYTNHLIVDHFDILVWVTISQEYSVPQILSQLLSQENEGSEHELGERVHKRLWGRRYLIVMDDIWGIEVWDQVKSFFPNNNNGSRVMTTSRLSNLAFDLSGSRGFQMSFLDEDRSWTLFCKIVFGKEDCPIELENIAKDIVRNCRGLPLSIVVIGGLLKNSNMTRKYWEYILGNQTSLINLENDECCLQLLRTSYKELPIHLKPCFLYMGIFPEDDKIRVLQLIKLWVAEGILRPSEDKRLEEVAEEYIMELIDRNLVLVNKLRWNGDVKFCKIHDLLRDLCLREAKKQRFLCVIKDQHDLNIPECMNMERRICIHDNIEEGNSSQLPLDTLKSAALVRSFILRWGCHDLFSSLNYRLLRVFSEVYELRHLGPVESIFENVNLRCLIICVYLPPLSKFPSSWILLWNLQTMKIDNRCASQPITAPSKIWEMLLLRHVIISNIQLPEPRCGENDHILEDLQTLSWVTNLKCSKALIKKIPNIKILKIKYHMSGETKYDQFCLNNFGHLHNLQTLSLDTGFTSLENLSFPRSLKKLILCAGMLNWQECMPMIGWLPFLEYLKLDWGGFWEANWETVEGQFCSLKFLHLRHCSSLRYWRTDSSHFPRLEHLFFEGLNMLEEVPSSVGDIPTLKSIRLDRCSESAEKSARIIKEEQMELGNLDLTIHIGRVVEEGEVK